MKKGKSTPRNRRTGAQVPMPAEPVDVTVAKAKKLPMFGPGIVINIPLSLAPAYLELYNLKPNGMSATGVVLVKRVPQGGANGKNG